MEFKNPLIVVSDIKTSVAFYQKILGLNVVLDFGANVTLTGGLCLQTKSSWREFICVKDSEIRFGGKDAELYFEEDHFDVFAEKLAGFAEIEYVHPVSEHRWGQRVVRFYDPDCHIIEVGENIKSVCRRFATGGMAPGEVAKRMDVSLTFVREALQES